MFYIEASTVILLFLGFGLWHRHRINIHVPTMIVAFILDVILVVFIELNRQAVERAVSETGNGLLMFHVGVSLSVILLYVALMYTGSKIMKHPNPKMLSWHRILAALFIVCRLTNYVTSFWVGR